MKVKLFIRKHHNIMYLLAGIYSFTSLFCIRIRNFKKVQFEAKGAFLQKVKVECHGKNNVISISEACRIRNCKFVIYGDNNNITIQNDCEIRGTEFWCMDGAAINIHNNVYMAGRSHVASTEGKTIEIGARCLIAHDVVMRNGDSHSILDENGNRTNNAKNVKIGDRVWIGQRAMILKGCTIGDDSAIGAASIATGKNFEANSLIAGSPAKIIKSGIHWDSKTI